MTSSPDVKKQSKLLLGLLFYPKEGNRTMDDDARKQKALKLADQAARREAHEDGAFAAEVVRREHGDDFEGARYPAQRAYDAAWIAAYAECREDFEALMLALLNAYDGEKHPASVTAAMLADACWTSATRSTRLILT